MDVAQPRRAARAPQLAVRQKGQQRARERADVRGLHQKPVRKRAVDVDRPAVARGHARDARGSCLDEGQSERLLQGGVDCMRRKADTVDHEGAT